MEATPNLKVINERSAAPPGNGAFEKETKVGSYFVSNYPPYSYWTPERVPDALAALDRPYNPATPLGLYLHIPFCRKRCHFCYFKVYTDKNASEIEAYLDAAMAELEMLAAKPVLAGRRPAFVYFGGGTPSYISTTQLSRLVERMQQLVPWTGVQEVAFECEPGTVTEPKLRLIRDLGVTRLSIGLENFDDEILKINGRAHSSKEIDRIFGYARSIEFPQINIDLIAGMVGETDENWQECVRKTLALAPDSVTIYQMEVPHNTILYRDMREHGQSVAPVATWRQKRDWLKYAFGELEKAGYYLGSAYTAVKNKENGKFLYRDMLWRGADMIGVGVASISHANRTHYQNEHEIGAYMEKIRQGHLPIFRALTPTADELLIREFVLQMKLGRLTTGYFRDKFGVNVEERFAAPLARLQSLGLLQLEDGVIQWSRDGLMQVDQMLSEFFLPEHGSARPS